MQTQPNNIDQSSWIPQLQPGIFILENSEGSGEIYVGATHRGIWLQLRARPDLRTLLLEIRRGAKSIYEYSRKYQVASSSIQKILQPLIDENYLILAPPQTAVHPRYQKLGNAHSLHISERMKGQENISRWRSPENPGDEIRRREDFSILIFGESPLALTIYSLLLASGFTHCKIISRRRGIRLHNSTKPSDAVSDASSGVSSSSITVKRVVATDICGLNLGTNELGEIFAEAVKKIRKSSALFYKENLAIPQTPHFIISTETVPADFSQRWISEAIPHLSIADLDESFLEVGPLVIPGATACLHCVALEKAADNPIYRDIELMKSLEPAAQIPGALAALIAGLVVLELCEFAAIGSSNLIAHSLRYDARNPSAPVRRYWNRSHECGCTGINV